MIPISSRSVGAELGAFKVAKSVPPGVTQAIRMSAPVIVRDWRPVATVIRCLAELETGGTQAVGSLRISSPPAAATLGVGRGNYA
jgi:hypothetical protein